MEQKDLKNQEKDVKPTQTKQEKQKRPRVPDPQEDVKQTQIKKKRKVLSFEDEEGHVEVQIEKPKLKQFNHHLERQISSQDEQNLRKRLKEQFIKDSQKKGEELFELEYSYWESGDIIKKLKMKKKQKIIDLLQICRLELIHNFQNLAKVSAEELMFVIKDFMAPHSMSIHEIQMLNIKTKTGEGLLNFHKVNVKREGKQFQMFVNIGTPIRVVQRWKYQKSKTFHPFAIWHTLDFQKSK